MFLTGLTSTDFLVLPENSRISLIYEGECLAEGFLGLRRLWRWKNNELNACMNECNVINYYINNEECIKTIKDWWFEE